MQKKCYDLRSAFVLTHPNFLVDNWPDKILKGPEFLLGDKSVFIDVNIIEPIREGFRSVSWFWLEKIPELKMKYFRY